MKVPKSSGHFPLQQKYLKSGAYLTPENSTTIKRLIIHERKDPSITKPPFYIMGELTENKKPFYISSLYPRSNDTYLIEYKQKYYTISGLESDKVLISEEVKS